MPIRFSTEAANADHMRMQGDSGMPEGMPDEIGADGTPRDRNQRGSRARPAAQRDDKDNAPPDERDKETAAKPGKDINAAGFVKDKDAGKP